MDKKAELTGTERAATKAAKAEDLGWFYKIIEDANKKGLAYIWIKSIEGKLKSLLREKDK
ncbi:MAG: hypothetical protein QXK65_03170 [Candidatus Micrarchaeaceae archaeon]